MIEKVYTFGNNSLVGVLTESEANAHKNGTPAVLLWNAGLLHRVGPNRLYVDLARKLAFLGFVVFRFDLSGKGDSEIQKESLSEQKRTVNDIQEAMNFLLARKRVHEFVLIGLCSGADEAHSVAVVDSRVSGVIFLDAYGYRTLGFYAHHYGPRLFKLTVWKNFIKRHYSSIVSRACKGTDRSQEEKAIFEREFPPKKKVKSDMEALIKRGVDLMYIYSGGVKYGYYNYHGQFKDMFRGIGFNGKVQLECFDKADHTYTSLGARSKLITTVCDWMLHHYRGDNRGSSVPSCEGNITM